MVARLRRLFGSRAFIAAVAGFASGALAIATKVYEVFPGLKPDPGEKNVAELAVLAVERNITRAKFAELARDGGACAGEEREDANGVVAYVEVRLEGFKSEKTQLRCALYDASTRTRSELQTQKAIQIKGLAPVDRAITRIWIRVPSIRHHFTARFELLSEKGKLLAFADSEPFEGGRSSAALAARPASRTEGRTLRSAIAAAPETSATRGKYRVAPLLVSTRGPWAFADLVPRRGYALDFEPAAAVLHRVGRRWRFAELLTAESSACDTHMPEPVVEGLGLGSCS